MLKCTPFVCLFVCLFVFVFVFSFVDFALWTLIGSRPDDTFSCLLITRFCDFVVIILISVVWVP